MLILKCVVGSQSWLQPAFSRLAPTTDALVSAARDAPDGIVFRSCEREMFLPLLSRGQFPFPPLPSRDALTTLA